MTVPTLSFKDASDADDAGEYMWEEDLRKLTREQEAYERARMESAQALRRAACALMEKAAAQADPGERDRFIEQARLKLRLARDPRPQSRQVLERREQIVARSCGRPAVLLRPSVPGHRETYHTGPECGLISGKGRHLQDSSWAPVGEAVAAGYRPCDRCGTQA
ncbi:Hypothetical Protein sle_34380 [Streptomyces leeuwenhoekii]|uniref:Uncharacterized protein n=1 Tax=Streptomyces leeuwenhoekii TaxID=1437453 RepID=A0A0F7VR12_STRLW|nr:Hypothetical Protein sle_34380 [Streptomyces leeuwenhoekii]